MAGVEGKGGLSHLQVPVGAGAEDHLGSRFRQEPHLLLVHLDPVDQEGGGPQDPEGVEVAHGGRAGRGPGGLGEMAVKGRQGTRSLPEEGHLLGAFRRMDHEGDPLGPGPLRKPLEEGGAHGIGRVGGKPHLHPPFPPPPGPHLFPHGVKDLVGGGGFGGEDLVEGHPGRGLS